MDIGTAHLVFQWNRTKLQTYLRKPKKKESGRKTDMEAKASNSDLDRWLVNLICVTLLCLGRPIPTEASVGFISSTWVTTGPTATTSISMVKTDSCNLSICRQSSLAISQVQEESSTSIQSTNQRGVHTGQDTNLEDPPSSNPRSAVTNTFNTRTTNPKSRCLTCGVSSHLSTVFKWWSQ